MIRLNSVNSNPPPTKTACCEISSLCTYSISRQTYQSILIFCPTTLPDMLKMQEFAVVGFLLTLSVLVNVISAQVRDIVI